MQVAPTTDLPLSGVTPEQAGFHTGLPDDNRELEPPESIPNSEVKRFIADGSVRFPHVRVGHRQVSIRKPRCESNGAFSFLTPGNCSYYIALVRRATK